MPEVSILMSVRNGEDFVKDSIHSILQQSFEDFELIILDDGSTDGTVDIIQSYSDSRIRLECREHKYISNLNEGLHLARGKFVARMDADDIMHRERIRIQVKRMKQKPEITVCGTWMKPFRKGQLVMPLKADEYEIENPMVEMIRGNIMFNPTTIIRKSFLENFGIHYQDYPCAEDYKFWVEIAKHGGIFFIEPQNLLFHRISEQQVTSRRKQEMIEQSNRIKKEIINYLLNQPQYKHEGLKKIVESYLEIEDSELIHPETFFGLLYIAFRKIIVR